MFAGVSNAYYSRFSVTSTLTFCLLNYLLTFCATEYTENTEKCMNFCYFLTNKLASGSGPVPQGGMISVV